MAKDKKPNAKQNAKENTKKNAKENAKANTDVSKSKAKREERKKEVAKKRLHKRTIKITGIVIAAAIIVLTAIAAGKSIYLAAIRTTSDSNLSAGLTVCGKIEGVNVKDILTLADYANISVPADEVAATDEEVEADINSTLESYKELNTDTSLEIADGDEVNIDYVGTIDGVEFDGGNSNGEGYDLTIGSGSFVDDFEQQLIGHKPGENVTVEVTFPEDYSSEDVAGKDASFAVTINGINTAPELTDEFVVENLSGEDDENPITTADAYRESVKNRFYEQHLEDYLTNYIVENSTVKSYPSAYVKAIKAVTKYDDEYMLQYYNQMFSSYGMSAYENVWDTRDDSINDELSFARSLSSFS